MTFLLLAAIFGIGALIGVVLHRAFLGVTWPIRRAIREMEDGPDRRAAWIMLGLAGLYVLLAVAVILPGGMGLGDVLVPAVLLAVAIAATPAIVRSTTQHRRRRMPPRAYLRDDRSDHDDYHC